MSQQVTGTGALKRICIAAGGTGGHIFPALSLAQEIRRQHPDCRIEFIGSSDRMENTIVPEAGYPLYTLDTQGYCGGIAGKTAALVKCVKACVQARRHLRKNRPQAVIGFGGYTSVPALLAAQSLGIPTIVHEQNSVAGLSNRLAARNADHIVTCFKNAAGQFKKDVVRLGNPRATAALQAEKKDGVLEKYGLPADQKLVVIAMGSLGSRSVTDAMTDILSRMTLDCHVLYVCGRDNEEDVARFSSFERVTAVPFADMLELYPYMDALVCRAGATTLAEICALGVPSVLIPSPYVTANHQYWNAKELADEHAVFMIEEADLCRRSLESALESLLDPVQASSMRDALKKHALPNASSDLLHLLEQTVSA